MENSYRKNRIYNLTSVKHANPIFMS